MIPFFLSEQQESDVLKLCEAADYAQFSDLPSFIKGPLLRLLDSLGQTVGYVSEPIFKTDDL